MTRDHTVGGVYIIPSREVVSRLEGRTIARYNMRSMSHSLPRRSLFVLWLRISLAAGAVYDALFGLILLVMPHQLSEILGVPLPEEGFYLWLIALLLGLLAGFYLLPVYDPVAYVGNILLAILGRAAGAVVLALAALVGGEGLHGLYLAALAEALFALAHGVLWWAGRR